jgi:hypothetical protein
MLILKNLDFQMAQFCTVAEQGCDQGSLCPNRPILFDG